MRIGWLNDFPNPNFIGGAELAAKRFRQGAPEGMQILDCRPGEVHPDFDLYVIHNCCLYSEEDIKVCLEAPTVKYWHDVGPHVSPSVKELLSQTQQVCVSPLQREKMGIEASLIPPAVDVERFREAAQNVSQRSGAVAVGPWMGPGKGADLVVEWGEQNGGIDIIGGGEFAPPGAFWVDPDEMPERLVRYKTYVHLPRSLEPCSRSTVEAWAAGCNVIVNRLDGSRYWITEEPEKLDTSIEDFWELCLGGVLIRA